MTEGSILDGLEIVRIADVDGGVYGDPALVKLELGVGPWELDDANDCFQRRTEDFIAAQEAVWKTVDVDAIGAQIRLDQAIARLNIPLTQKDGPDDNLAPDGAYYDALCWTPETPEETARRLDDDPDAVIAAYVDKLGQYIGAHPGDVLWWRLRPRIAGGVRFGEIRATWVAYAVLRIGTEAA